MAYRFQNNRPASARIYRTTDDSNFKVAGINGEQTNAANFHTAITGLLNVIGLSQRKLERDITQSVEDLP